MTSDQIQKIFDRLIRQGPDAILTKRQATALIAHRTVKEPNEVRKAAQSHRTSDEPVDAKIKRRHLRWIAVDIERKVFMR